MKSKRWLSWLSMLLVALLLVVAGILVVGWNAPAEHHAIGRTTVAASPERVWEILTDVGAAPDWRTGLDRVEVISGDGEPLVYREHGDFGAMLLGVDEAAPPKRLVTRILDEDLGFGGTWTYELRPVTAGTEVQIREDGVIDSLLFRGMTRLFFGYTATLEAYLHDLARVAGGDGIVATETSN